MMALKNEQTSMTIFLGLLFPSACEAVHRVSFVGGHFECISCFTRKGQGLTSVIKAIYKCYQSLLIDQEM